MTEEQNGSRRLEEMYRPPATEEAAPLPGPSLQAPFYVVSRNKFLVLFFATFGGYQMYWFFVNWRRYRDRTGSRLSPFWRAVFSPFFVHKLFGIVAYHPAPSAEAPSTEATAAPAPARFAAPGMATAYVVLVVASRLLDRLGSGVLLDVVSIALGLGTAYPLLAAQQAANAASGDPAGSANSGMTPLNYVFLVLGVVLWPLVVLGFASME
jgi:hypothetical protein